MKERLIVDLTKSFPDRLGETLARVETVLDHLSLGQGQLHLVGRGDQVIAREQWPEAQWQPANERTAVAAIHTLLNELASRDEKPDLVHVVSFNVEVLNKCGGAQTDFPIRLSASHLANWEPKREMAARQLTLHRQGAGALEGEVPDQSQLAADRVEKEELSRSSRMEAAIRDKRHGPYSGIRHRLYNIMDREIGTMSGCSLREFVDGCVDRLQEEGTGDSRYSWNDVGSTVIKILAEAEVALGAESEPLPSGSHTARGMPIHSLAENWQVRADAELAMIIIDSLGDVSEYDYPDLAGTLYHDRKRGDQDRVAEVLAELIRQGRIEEVQVDGTFYLRSCGSKDEKSMKLLKKPS